jgi:hypothetical protein
LQALLGFFVIHGAASPGHDPGTNFGRISPMPQVTSVEINAEGSPRTIFTIREATSTDLNIFLRRSAYAPVDALSFEGAPKMVEHRYTVHVSPQSVMNINVIKRTMRLANEERTESVTNTRSIKQTNSFTPLLFEQCSNLAKPQYVDTDKKYMKVSLGEYDPSNFILLYGLFVGPRDRAFAASSFPPPDANIKEIAFNNFHIVVTWCFLALSSADIGEIIHFSTETPERFIKPPPERKKSTGGFFDGFSDDQCIVDFQWRREAIRMRILQNFARANPTINPRILSGMILWSKFYLLGLKQELSA